MDAQQNLFILFWVIVVGFLVVDLGFFNRKAHRIGPKSALIQSIFWIVLSLCFAFLIFIFLGSEKAALFMTAYSVEKMLSVDNLFVIMLIFSFFKLDEKYHHRVLFWGILGAIVFRAIFILLGALIISQFQWVMYIFGAILIYTGIKIFKDKKEEHVDFKKNPVFRLATKYLPFTANHHNGKFLVREQGKLHVTVLFMILLMVETTDIIFAIDSIPAAFAITQDPFIVFTSNIFAVMGLRALFFLLQNVLHKFHHLQKGLSFILVFIGAKMFFLLFGFHLSPFISFGIIAFALCASLILSVLFPKKI
jgi:tellurite resistance protein TerC